MSRIDIEDILDRYLKGEASPEEMEHVEAWLDEHHAASSTWQQMDKNRRDQWHALNAQSRKENARRSFSN